MTMTSPKLFEEPAVTKLSKSTFSCFFQAKMWSTISWGVVNSTSRLFILVHIEPSQARSHRLLCVSHCEDGWPWFPSGQLVFAYRQLLDVRHCLDFEDNFCSHHTSSLHLLTFRSRSAEWNIETVRVVATQPANSDLCSGGRAELQWQCNTRKTWKQLQLDGTASVMLLQGVGWGFGWMVGNARLWLWLILNHIDYIFDYNWLH